MSHSALKCRAAAVHAPVSAIPARSLEDGARRTVENLKQALESDHAAATTSEPLARFIYVTSLDLQESLRRIEAFSDLLENALASSNKADMHMRRKPCAATRRPRASSSTICLTYSSAVMGGQRLEMLDMREEIDALLRDHGGVIADAARMSRSSFQRCGLKRIGPSSPA